MNVEIYGRMYLSERDNWWYKSRRELITDMIGMAKQLCDDGDLKIFDVGCGTGLNSKCFERFGYVFGLDISEEALKFSKSRGNSFLIRGCADDLPLKDESFDILCALDLLEHVEDDIGAIEEFSRILKPGGYLVLTVPAFTFLWSGHDEALHHKRRYEKGLLVNRLQSGGFSVIKSTYWNCFLFPGVALMRSIKKRKCSGGRRDDLLEINHYLSVILFVILKLEHVYMQENMTKKYRFKSERLESSSIVLGAYTILFLIFTYSVAFTSNKIPGYGDVFLFTMRPIKSIRSIKLDFRFMYTTHILRYVITGGLAFVLLYEYIRPMRCLRIMQDVARSPFNKELIVS